MRLAEKALEPGGTYPCRVRGCEGLLFHAYDDSGETIEGMVCSDCGDLGFLRHRLTLTSASTGETK